MAHLSTDEARGQLLLVGGIVVALTVVGVALVLNSLVLTDTLATSEPPRGIDHADEYESVVADGVTRVVRVEERTPYGTWSAAEANATASVAHVSRLARNRTLQGRDAYTGTTVVAARRGATLAQNNSSRAFTNADDTANWTLGETAGVRNFRMRVDATTLTEVEDSASTNATGGLPGFTVNVTGDGGDVWSAYLTRDDDNSSVRVVVDDGTDVTVACQSENETATVDWTNESIGSRSCNFTFADGLTPEYELSFDDGDEATGTYHLVVSDETADETVQTTNFDNLGDNPYQHPAVYSLVLDVSYDGPAVAYDTDVRVAPGEPPHLSP